jgi:protein-tyrosine phosphatase
MTLILPGIYLGGINEAYNFEWLKQHKVTHILNVAQDADCLFLNEFKYMKFDLEDIPTQKLVNVFPQAYAFISYVINNPKNVLLIHCRAGISRSASILIYALMRRFGLTYNAALLFVRSKRPIVNPNSGFVKELEIADDVLTNARAKRRLMTLTFLRL